MRCLNTDHKEKAYPIVIVKAALNKINREDLQKVLSWTQLMKPQC